jgi:hypothetical protein
LKRISCRGDVLGPVLIDESRPVRSDVENYRHKVTNVALFESGQIAANASPRGIYGGQVLEGTILRSKRKLDLSMGDSLLTFCPVPGREQIGKRSKGRSKAKVGPKPSSGNVF